MIYPLIPLVRVVLVGVEDPLSVVVAMAIL